MSEFADRASAADESLERTKVLLRARLELGEITAIEHSQMVCDAIEAHQALIRNLTDKFFPSEG